MEKFWNKEVLNEVKEVLRLTLVRDDYENSEYRNEIPFLGGALLQYAWCTQEVETISNVKTIRLHFDNLVEFKYEGVYRGKLDVDTFTDYLDDNNKTLSIVTRICKNIRECFTLDDFLQEIEIFRKTIIEDLGINNRLSIICMLGYLLFDEMIYFCNEDILRYLVTEFLEYLPNKEEIKPSNYLHKGMPLIRSQEKYNEFKSGFKGKTLVNLQDLEVKSKTLYLERKDLVSNLTKEEFRNWNFFRSKAVDFISTRYSSDDLKDLMRSLISLAEDEIIHVLAECSPLYDVLDNALYKCSLNLIEHEKPLEQLISNTLIEECKNELDEILNLAQSLTNINVNLGNQLARISMVSTQPNSDKYALVLRNHGMSLAKYWIANITFEIDSRVQFYTDFVKEGLCDRRTEIDYDDFETNVIAKTEKAKKSLKNVTKYKELNKIANNKGFEKIRQKGDHGIFRRYDGSTVVIPQGRNIGKGLSYRIQKDMNRLNACGYVTH